MQTTFLTTPELVWDKPDRNYAWAGLVCEITHDLETDRHVIAAGTLVLVLAYKRHVVLQTKRCRTCGLGSQLERIPTDYLRPIARVAHLPQGAHMPEPDAKRAWQLFLGAEFGGSSS